MIYKEIIGYMVDKNQYILFTSPTGTAIKIITLDKDGKRIHNGTGGVCMKENCLFCV